MIDDPSARSRPFVAAGALFWDEAGRIMLVRPTYKDGWDLPGGYVELNEAPRETCIREVKEELDLDVELGQLLVADWAPHVGEGDKLLFVFEGGQLAPEQVGKIRLQADEIAEYSFFETADLGTTLIPRLARRVVAAIEARAEGMTHYLEHGRAASVIPMTAGLHQ